MWLVQLVRTLSDSRLTIGPYRLPFQNATNVGECSKKVSVFFVNSIKETLGKVSQSPAMSVSNYKDAKSLSDESNVTWDDPPPYELHSSGAILASTCTLKGNHSALLSPYNTDSSI